jgi:hypothetical protein
VLRGEAGTFARKRAQPFGMNAVGAQIEEELHG